MFYKTKWWLGSKTDPLHDCIVLINVQNKHWSVSPVPMYTSNDSHIVCLNGSLS